MDSQKIHREELADLVSNPDQKKKTKKKKKPKSVLTQQEAEAQPSELNREHKQQLVLPRKPYSSSPPPPRDTNSELSPKPDSSVNSKKKRKRNKSALKREEELCPEFPSKIESMPANAKDPTQGRKEKKPKSVLDADDIEKRPELDSLPPKDSEPDREKKKKKKKKEKEKEKEKEKKNQNGVNIIEGSELNTSNAENPNVLPGLDPSSPKVSEPDQQKKEKKEKKNKNSIVDTEHKQQLLLPRKPDSSSSPPRDTNPELFPKPDSSFNSKKKRKKKKSPLKREGEFPTKIESMPVEKDPTQGRKKKKPKSVLDADDIEKRPELDSLPAKDSEPDREKKKKQKKKKEKKKNQNGANIIEGSELNTSNAENPKLLPGLDPSSPKVSEPDQQKKEKKNNSIVNGKGAEPNSANVEPRTDQGKRSDFRARKFEHRSVTPLVSKDLGYIPTLENKPGRKHKFKGKGQGQGEVCYFCMKHGHTLGICPKSPGARFANCPLCDQQGHISSNCREKEPSKT